MIIISIVGMCLIAALSIGILFAYRLGVKDRLAIDKGEALKPIVQPKPKPPEETDAEREKRMLEEDIREFRNRGGKP